MKRAYAFFLFAVALLLSPPLHAQDHTKHNQIVVALRTIPSLKEFSQLYPNAFYTFRKENGRHIITARTVLAPYYEFVMRVPVAQPVADQPLFPTGPAEIELWRILEVTIDDKGNPQARMQNPPLTLDTRKWVELVMAKGKFEDVGIKLDREFMLPRIDEYRNFLRDQADVGW